MIIFDNIFKEMIKIYESITLDRNLSEQDWQAY